MTKIVNIKDATKPKRPATVCAKCRHFVVRARGPMGGDIWYNQFCGHPETQGRLEIDPVTGREGYRRVNDLGGTYYDDRPEPFARDINTGNCPYFEAG